jgi:hypothetical protein
MIIKHYNKNYFQTIKIMAYKNKYIKMDWKALSQEMFIKRVLEWWKIIVPHNLIESFKVLEDLIF